MTDCGMPARFFGTLMYHAPNRRHPSVNLPVAVTAAMLPPCSLPVQQVTGH